MSSALATEVTSQVPVEWNTTPLRNGAYTETFSDPDAAWTTGASETTNLSAYATTSVPARTNDWFNGATTALALDTEGESITNVLEESGASVPATAENPAYIDMLVRFDVIEDAPEASTFDGAKLALYAAEVDSQIKLVCWANNAYYTNNVTTATDVWNRVTIKLSGNNFNVLLNDEQQTFKGPDGTTDVTEFTLASGGTLNGTIFRGTGNLANLYVSHCDPKYGVAGATTTASKTLSSDNKTALGDEDLTRVNKWLADNSIAAATGDNAALTGYMLNADAAVETVDLSITSIDVVSPTQVKVKVGLAIDGTAKTGSINGVLRLEGATAEGGAYTLLNETVVTDAEFESGNSAEYTFDIPAGGYHIFKPVLSVQ